MSDKVSAAVSSKPHILVIEDEEGIRYMLQTKLYQMGFRVSVAATGLHAMQKFKSGQVFDLILCDLKMPGMSGLDLYKVYTSSKGVAPFVIMTGYPERDKIMQAVQLGVRDVILKPIAHQELIGRISSYLDSPGRTSSSAA